MKHIVNVARIRPSSAKTDALSALNKQTASKRLARPSSAVEYKISIRSLIPSILHPSLLFLKLRKIITNRVLPLSPGKSVFNRQRSARKTLSFIILRLFRLRKILGQ